MSVASLAFVLIALILAFVLLGVGYIGMRMLAPQASARVSRRLPDWLKVWGRRGYMAMVVSMIVALLVVSAMNFASQPPLPSPTISSTPTPSPSSSPSPSTTPPSGATQETVWKYNPDKFRDVSGNWKAAWWNVGGSRVYALGTRTKGCGPDSNRQIRYPGLPADWSKTLQFSFGFDDTSATTNTPISGKVQFKSKNSDKWSRQQEFSAKFGEVKTYRFPAGDATDILVSFYPTESTCAKADVVIVEFDAQIEFRQ